MASLFLELLIEQIERHGEDAGVLRPDVLEIVDMSDEVADSLSLALDDLLFQVVGETGVVVVSL